MDFKYHFGVHLVSNLAPDGLRRLMGRLGHIAFKSYMFFAYLINYMANVIIAIGIIYFLLAFIF